MANNIPQFYSSNPNIATSRIGAGYEDTQTILRGAGDLVAGAQRAYQPFAEKRQRQEELTQKTNLIKLQRSVEDEALRAYDEIQGQEGFAQLSTEEAVNLWQDRVNTTLDAQLDAYGFQGAEREYYREQALGTKRVASARVGIGTANSQAKVDDVNTTLTGEVNIISNRLLDAPDTLKTSLEDLRDKYGTYVDVLGEDRVRKSAMAQAPVLIETSVQGYVNQGRFAEARALLNDKGEIKVTSALSADQRNTMLEGVDRAEAQLIKAQQAAADEQQKITDAAALVGAAYGGAVILDDRNKDHRDAVNLFFDQMTPQLAEMNPNDRTETLAEFVGGVKVVPDAIKTMIRTSKFAPAEQQAETAAFIGKVEELAPGLLQSTSGLTDVDMARSELINSMVASGQSVTDAVERTSQIVDPNNSAMMKARKEAFGDIDPITADAVADSFDSLLNWQADVPDHLVAELERDVNGVFLRQYQLTGDEDVARDYALKQAAKIWGKTEADGGKRLIKYPPEAFYAFNDDNGWMQQQLVADVSEFLTAGVAGYTDEGRPIVRNGDGSVSTERTITVTDERINGGKPTNIPTMFGGVELSPDEAADIIASNNGSDPETGRVLAGFETIEDAERAAMERSKALGAKIDAMNLTRPNTDDLEDRVFIVSDALTARQAGMQTPTYQVLLQDDNGAFVPLDVRWAPDSAKAAEEWRKARIEEGREKRDRDAVVDVPIKIDGEDAGSLITIGKFDWGNAFSDSTWRPRDPETGEAIEPAQFFGEGPDSTIAPDLNE